MKGAPQPYARMCGQILKFMELIDFAGQWTTMQGCAIQQMIILLLANSSNKWFYWQPYPRTFLFGFYCSNKFSAHRDLFVEERYRLIAVEPLMDGKACNGTLKEAFRWIFFGFGLATDGAEMILMVGPPKNQVPLGWNNSYYSRVIITPVKPIFFTLGLFHSIYKDQLETPTV